MQKNAKSKIIKILREFTFQFDGGIARIEPMCPLSANLGGHGGSWRDFPARFEAIQMGVHKKHAFWKKGGDPPGQNATLFAPLYSPLMVKDFEPKFGNWSKFKINDQN